MAWLTICAKVCTLRAEFDKSYKCLTQNRPTQNSTVIKHVTNLVEIYNEIRELFLTNKQRLDDIQWFQATDVFKRLRERLVTVKEKLNLDIHIPTILNTAATYIPAAESGSRPISPRPPNIKNISIISEDDSRSNRSNLPINDDTSSTSAAPSNQHIRMAEDPVAQRAYIKDISHAIPEFNGQKIHMQRFITAINLVNLTKGPYESLAVEVIKSKIIGSTLYKVQDETTIQSIIQKLKTTIVGETSDVVKAKMAKICQKGKTATEFTKEIDEMRKLLEASYIDEGLPAEHADKFSSKEAISTMVKNCEHGRLKTILEAGTFPTMNDAITKYIQCSTDMTGNANSILYTRRGQAYRGSTYRGNYRGRGNGRGYNNINSYNNNQHSNNYRGRGGYRGNNRGNGNTYNNQYDNNRGTRQNNVRVTQTASGNSQTPLDTPNH